MYLTSCNLDEDTGTQTIETTSDALKSLYPSIHEIETRNLADAFDRVFDENFMCINNKKEIRYLELIKTLNYEIGKNEICKNAGVFRTVYVKPFNFNNTYLRPDLIEINLIKLFKTVQLDKTNITKQWFEEAANFLSTFLFIHPFYDGNGRTSKLLMSLILQKIFIVPVCVTCYHDKLVFLKCMIESHQYQNLTLLSTLIIESVYNSLHFFIQRSDL